MCTPLKLLEAVPRIGMRGENSAILCTDMKHQTLPKIDDILKEKVGSAAIVSNPLMTTYFAQLKNTLGQDLKGAAITLQVLVTDQDLANMAEELLRMKTELLFRDY